ncbi:T9SS type A sorting domain-containing protein, partial [candidate division KSB1 bacterium]|nr:T9SS type A sorting domain-containing protein [candidate division KSB1 bacterium]
TNYFESDVDTLSNEYIPPFFPFYEKYRTAYESTRLFAPRTAVVKKILTAFINSDQTERSKTCEFFIWKDNGNLPGKMLFRDSLEVSLRQGEMNWQGIDFSDKPITVSGHFWIGHREHGTGYPTSLVDESAAPGANFTSTDGISWSEEYYDYLQCAIVDYQADPLEGVNKFTIYNVGTLGLDVSNIHSDRNWVRGIGPSVFSIAADDSQVVQVYINARGLEPGVYDGKLLIESNDPSAPLVEKNTRLIVHGQTGVDHFFQKDTPDNFSLIDNYPNPFNQSTKIEYEIHQATYVVLNIYNILGQIVASLIDEKQVPGRYSLDWNGVDKNGSPLSSGIYICRMTTANFEQTIKLMLLR